MKKLLRLLGAFTLTTTAAASVVACGSKTKSEQSIEDEFISNLNSQEEKDAYMATSDITKALLAGRGEILGIRKKDPFKISEKLKAESINYANLFSKSNKNDGSKYGARFDEHFQSWSSQFGENFDIQNFNSKNILSENVDMVSFENDTYNLESENLTSLLLDDDTISQNAKDTSLFKPGNLFSEQISNGQEKIIDRVKTINEVKNSNFGQIGEIITGNFDASKVQLMLGMMSEILPFSKTNGGLANPNDPSKGVGQLKQWWFGGNFLFEAKTVMGDKLGVVTTFYENAFLYFVNNKETLISSLGENLYNIIVGTKVKKTSDDKVYLIDKTINKLDEAAQSLDKTIISSYNDGMFGEFVNELGKVKYHNKKNWESGAIDKLEGDFYSKGNFHLLDLQVDKVLAKSVELYEVTTKLLNNEQKDALLKEVVPAGLISLITGLIGLNFPSIPLAIEFGVDIIKGLLDFNGNGEITNDITKEEIKEMYSIGEKGFKLTTVNNLKAPSPKNGTNWFTPENDEYRSQVFEIMGMKDNKIIENTFLGGLKETLKNPKYKDLFGNDWANNYDEMNAYLNDYIYKTVIDPKTWVPKNILFEKNEFNQISSIEYTLEYVGLGYLNVAEFKTTDEVTTKTANEIINLLGKSSSKYDEEFKTKFNGTGNILDLQNVNYRYTVKWVNESNAIGINNMKLDYVIKPEVLINGKWIEMGI